MQLSGRECTWPVKVKFTPQHQRELRNMRLSSLLVMARKWVETGLQFTLLHFCVSNLLILWPCIFLERRNDRMSGLTATPWTFSQEKPTHLGTSQSQDFPQSQHSEVRALFTVHGGVGMQRNSPAYSAQDSRIWMDEAEKANHGVMLSRNFSPMLLYVILAGLLLKGIHLLLPPKFRN